MVLIRQSIISVMIRRLKHRWQSPEGHDTGIKVFNCITRDKQPFIVKNKNLVTWYTCGPTVYDSCHIGHASYFVKLDIIQRILKEYFKLNIVSVMNITDVDDKIIARSNLKKIPVSELTPQVEKEFWRDLATLDVAKPDYVLRVTENIELIKTFIEKLLSNKTAYTTEDGSVYFDTQMYGNYGKLQNINQENLEEVKFKKSSMDFALWKACKPGEVFWESNWGPGRPGWHIECSALASHAFGSEIDIHAGGIDLRFPHHENEEAQSCAFHGKTQWVNYWLHTGHLHFKNSVKMSKSLKNTISIGEMLTSTTAQVFRMACVMSHYRSNMEFSEQFMETASNLLKNYNNFFSNCSNYISNYIKADVNEDVLNKLIAKSTEEIHAALSNDFNTPAVVKALNEIVSVVNNMLHSTRTDVNRKSVSIIAASNLVKATLRMLGVINNAGKQSESDENFVEVMNILNSFRQDVRRLGISSKDQTLLELCDSVRDNLKKCGIVVKDHGKTSSWW